MALEFKDKNYSLLVFMLVVVMFSGMFWLYANNVPAGELYAILTLSSIALAMLAFMFVKEYNVGFLIPVARTLDKSVAMLVFGFSLPLILYSFGGQSFIHLSQAFYPLANFGTGFAQSFNAIVIENSPGWTLFTIVGTAATLEEVVTSWLLVIVSFALAKVVFSLLNIKTSRWKEFTFALIILLFIFSGLHYFNRTYDSFEEYLVAALFKALMLLAVYVMNWTISFAIGFHAANNLLFIGGKTALAGLFTVPGAILLFIAFIVLFRFFSRLPTMLMIYSEMFSNIGLR